MGDGMALRTTGALTFQCQGTLLQCFFDFCIANSKMEQCVDYGSQFGNIQQMHLELPGLRRILKAGTAGETRRNIYSKGALLSDKFRDLILGVSQPSNRSLAPTSILAGRRSALG